MQERASCFTLSPVSLKVEVESKRQSRTIVRPQMICMGGDVGQVVKPKSVERTFSI